MFFSIDEMHLSVKNFKNEKSHNLNLLLYTSIRTFKKMIYWYSNSCVCIEINYSLYCN